MKKIREWLNVQLVKNPRGMVLGIILAFNIVFFLLSAIVISNLSLSGTEKMSFFEAMFCTITMILDAGCIQFVVADIGQSGVAIVIVCLVIIIIGMISFTGAVIGYVTNYISNFIDNANSGSSRIKISNHAVILNWNSRASEIINDLLYCTDEKNKKVIVLVNSRKDEIEKEIHERLADTVSRENEALAARCKNMNFLQKFFYLKKNKFRNKVTVIVREGDVFSSKQLHDISLEYASMVVILGNDINNTICKFEHKEAVNERGKGNSQTVKTLMQVADITAADYSSDKQKIIVEITDDWTAALVDRIIARKEVDSKCNIVPVRVNQILGHILSQFSLMPELNLAYKELFSNKGAAFYTEEREEEDEHIYIENYLEHNNTALPLTFMESNGKSHFYYSSASQEDILERTDVKHSNYRIKYNENYWIEQKSVVILGHNSRCTDIMDGFNAFRNEWGYTDGREIVRIVVIDDKAHLEKMNYYKEYPFVIECVPAEIYEQDTICGAIEKFVSSNEGDTSILILSDDSALNEDIDANALANLVYVQDIVRKKKLEEGDAFDENSMDIIVEIINPKHHDVVNSYSVNNVVISNRYISKMITQIGEKEALFDFYTDILTYDEAGSEGNYDSKEVYIKRVDRFFDEVPKKCTAQELVKAVYDATSDEKLPAGKRNPAVVLGYVNKNGKMTLFSGDRSKIKVSLTDTDKLIVFSNH